MKKIIVLIIVYYCFAGTSLAQRYPAQTYKEYLENEEYSKDVSNKIRAFRKVGNYHQLLEYLNEVDTARFNFSVRTYKASAYAALGDTLKAKEEVFLHMKYHNPNISISHHSKWYNIPEKELEEYLDSLLPAYLARNYPLMDTVMNNRLKEMQRKDQHSRIIDPVTNDLDSLQQVYDIENTLAIRSMVAEKGHWLTRYCTPDVNQLNVLVMHFSKEDKYALLPYMIEDCLQGYSGWEEPESVVWKLLMSDIYDYGYYKIYATIVDEKGKVNIEQSLLGLHTARSYMRYNDIITLQATTNYTNENYLEELERIRQYYISLGIEDKAILINPEKVKVEEFPSEPTCYIIFSVI